MSSYPATQHPPPPVVNQVPGGQPPSYQASIGGNTAVVTQTQQVVTGDGCPTCGGLLEDEFTPCGIILAILFFPIGIICCFMMTEKRCKTCRPVHVSTGPGYVPVYHTDTHIHHHDPFRHNNHGHHGFHHGHHHHDNHHHHNHHHGHGGHHHHHDHGGHHHHHDHGGHHHH